MGYAYLTGARCWLMIFNVQERAFVQRGCAPRYNSFLAMIVKQA